MSVDTVYATISNDSLIRASIGMLCLNTGSLRIDTAPCGWTSAEASSTTERI